jgi:probable phosphoglycerate mutase
MIRLALLRHGHTAWNRAGRIQGRSDIALDDDARAALSAHRLPAPWDGADLVSSPLARARETAELVGGRAPAVAPELLEMNWGAWEGLHGRDLIADPASGYAHIEDWGWDFRPPGGESPADLRARLVPWALGLRRDTVAVTHIGVMRVLLAQATGWDFRGTPPFKVKRNRLFVIEVDGALRLDPGAPVRLVERAACGS